ncbi:MAG TPA: vanadium-dependent haloperoxidase [Usitatibacter sp.]|nr:vanadium-dependent haloperoxidase [Usitatibacter sp.]
MANSKPACFATAISFPLAVGLLAAALAARADAVADWNATAIAVTATPPNSILQSRVLAIVQGAMFDAAIAVERRYPPMGADVIAGPEASQQAAIAAAAHGILSRLAPGQQVALDAALAATLAKVPPGAPRTNGINAGTEVAEKWIALRARDGADAKGTYTPAAGAGKWQPTPPANLPAILPGWGAVKPFVLKSAHQFDLKGPPAPASEAFARDLAEVRDLGARESSTRTADQTAAAIFWTIQTPVVWNAAARAASAARSLGSLESARVLALVNFACADSQIAGFEMKYRVSHWRPVTAIRQGGDAGWEPLLATPPHPEYPSAHMLCSGAAEAVLKGYFGADRVNVSVMYPPGAGITRSYGSFSQIAQEVEGARVWGGIHYRSADVDGRDLGRRIGEYVLEKFPPAR